MHFSLEGGGARDLAGIADGVLVSSGVPVEGFPLRGRKIAIGSANEHRYMLCVERVAMPSAISLPKMVIVNFCSGSSVRGISCRKHLTVYGAVLLGHFGSRLLRTEFGRNIGAVALPNHKGGRKLD